MDDSRLNETLRPVTDVELNEIERVAKAANDLCNGAEWWMDGDRLMVDHDPDSQSPTRIGALYAKPCVGEHIALCNPATALAMVAALREARTSHGQSYLRACSERDEARDEAARWKARAEIAEREREDVAELLIERAGEVLVEEDGFHAAAEKVLNALEADRDRWKAIAEGRADVRGLARLGYRALTAWSADEDHEIHPGAWEAFETFRDLCGMNVCTHARMAGVFGECDTCADEAIAAHAAKGGGGR